jgi:hypothetical protein
VPSVLWALIPLLTFGWGTGVSFAYATFRLRSRSLALPATAYLVASILSFHLVDASTSDSDWHGNVGAVLALGLMAVGTVHSFTLRTRMLGTGRTDSPHFVAQGSAQQQIIAAAQARIRQRCDARRIAHSDPILARELGIGRPDLRRRFDDGGLVDVNHATAPSLAMVPGINEELAGRIVQSRQSVGGFADLTDLSVTMGIAPPVLDESKEFLVFLRLPAA